LFARGHIRAGLTIILLVIVSPAAAQDEPFGPPDPPHRYPVTTTGSMGPGIYREDLTRFLRVAYLRSLTISPHDPKVAYIASFSGYVWKTEDGGKTWDESRLVVEPHGFFGDQSQYLYFGWQRINPPAGAPYDRTVARKPRQDQGGSAPTAMGEAGGGSGGGARGQAANLTFGIGLPGGAPRLQLFVRRWFKPTAGLNIKQTLLLQGTRGLEVRIVVVHPKDPKIVFACTAFGLYKSTDGGLNWVRVFTGTRFYNNAAVGRHTWHLAVDPLDPRRVLIATGEGMFISNDVGETFSKSTKQGLGDTNVNWIYFNPHDPRYVFVGTDYGLLRSKDRGENWEWIYFTTFPTGRVVREIQIDPFDKRSGYIATHDGLYTTPDLLQGGMDSWRRLGGLTFTGVETPRIVLCPKHKGHMWTLANIRLVRVDYPGVFDSGGSFLWESIDGGKTWNSIFSGDTIGSMQWFDSHPSDPDLLWIVWSRSISRLRHRRATDKLHEHRRAVIPDDPPIGDVITASFRYTGVEPSQQLGYRYRSRLKALVPRVDASYAHYTWNDLQLNHDALYPTLPFRHSAGWSAPYNEFRVMLTWDLAPLVFNLDASLFGRIDRLNGSLRAWLIHEMHYQYGELRRLRAEMANVPPEDLRVRLFYKLRIEELTAYIDYMTGGYLTYWRRGGRARGIKGKWWDPWVKKRPWWSKK
jgi:photosystem II stability/assembly factor-like uncharacterized protein